MFKDSPRINQAIAILFVVAALFKATEIPGPTFILKYESLIQHQIRGERELDDRFLIVYIDEEDIGNMGGWPISRDYYGYMTHALTQMNAQTIAIDILFAESTERTAEYDVQMSHFIAESNRAVLPMMFRSFQRQSTSPIFPFDSLVVSAQNIGFSNLYESSKNQIQHLKTTLEDRVFLSFGTAMAQEYLRNDNQLLSINNIPEKLVLNHFGDWQHIQHISFVELLKTWQADPATQDFSNKLVLVCMVYPGLNNPVSTSLAEELPPSLIHLTVAENLINGNNIRSAAWYWRLLAAALFGLFFYIFYFSTLSNRNKLICLLLLASTYLLFSIWLFQSANELLPLVIPFLLLGLMSIGAIGTHLTTKRLEQKHELELTSLVSAKSLELKQAESQMDAYRSELQGTSTVSNQYLEQINQGREHIIRLEKEIRDLQAVSMDPIASDSSPFSSTAIIHSAKGKMAKVLKLVHTFADSDLPILLVGETGTGKELIARELHRMSGRNNKPFVAMNCGALSQELLLSELFGHTRGSFTGAVGDRKGRFELAQDGTLFMDEITETENTFQSSLLRVLQEGTFERIGAEESQQVDVRIIAATNRNPETEVAEGRFRMDLYYRLSGMTIEIPGLRDRTEDIPLLVQHFIDKACKTNGSAAPGLAVSEEVLTQLRLYRWPGNVRELENIISRAVVLANSEGRQLIRLEDMPEEIRFAAAATKKVNKYTSLEDQILASMRELHFSHSAIMQTARNLGDRDRGTITEYLRGIIFRTLTECEFDIAKSSLQLAGNDDKETIAAAAKKINDYLSNLQSLLRNPDKDSKSAFRGLPKAYHSYLETLIAHLDRVDE